MTNLDTPTPEQAAGYDVVVWMDDDEIFVIKPYTITGEAFVVHLFGEVAHENGMELTIEPEDFVERVPKDLKVGFANPLKNLIFPMTRPLLH
jgi:hypothetical protein